jgi:hypothetical protein
MLKHAPRQQRNIEPKEVWERLDAAQQHRALHLLAQMALNFLTAHAVPPQTEESLCPKHAVTPRCEPITSLGPR